MISAPSAQEIRLARRRLGLMQREFAELLGVSERAVQGWECGDRRPAAYLRLALERVGALRAGPERMAA
jgi:DNA-binding transcriptional regulator YiaG